jgi:hypothetical protein
MHLNVVFVKTSARVDGQQAGLRVRMIWPKSLTKSSFVSSDVGWTISKGLRTALSSWACPGSAADSVTVIEATLVCSRASVVLWIGRPHALEVVDAVK